MKRRDFLKLTLLTALRSACGGKEARIGIALGGGGARGLAHILMLEVLDELGIQPCCIAGTSIGAVIGSLYASGKSAQEIKRILDQLTITEDESWLNALFEKDVSHWWSLIELQLGSGGLLKAAAFSHFLQKQLGVTRFNQLQIPLKIVAADFWNRNEVVFEKGHCTPELTINKPSYFETVFNAYQILQSSLIIEKLKNRQPHIYIRLDLQNIQVLDFNRVDEIFEQAKPARNKLRASLKSYQKD